MHFTIALDWTPNINHIGLFVASASGFYEREGLEVDFTNPADDNYQLTPGKKLELDLADFALAPFETVISLNNKDNRVNARAVYALLQEDLSSIACLKSSGIESPKQLDGKSYASYKARYEDHIVRQLILNDGGAGTPQLLYPDKLGIWNTLLKGQADATWIFDNWEGVEADTEGIALHRFSMRDFHIPYGYSPVILCKQETLDQKPEACVRFIRATRQGYLDAQHQPEAAVSILKSYVSERDRNRIDLRASLAQTAPYFGQADSCGRMQPDRVKEFLQWLVRHQLERDVILEQDLFTNALLDAVSRFED
jgi:ABC-type nitrate/sulfonate/bicarbonate transport system substrate-binding protein